MFLVNLIVCKFWNDFGLEMMVYVVLNVAGVRWRVWVVRKRWVGRRSAAAATSATRRGKTWADYRGGGWPCLVALATGTIIKSTGVSPKHSRYTKTQTNHERTQPASRLFSWDFEFAKHFQFISTVMCIVFPAKLSSTSQFSTKNYSSCSSSSNQLQSNLNLPSQNIFT